MLVVDICCVLVSAVGAAVLLVTLLVEIKEVAGKAELGIDEVERSAATMRMEAIGGAADDVCTLKDMSTEVIGGGADDDWEPEDLGNLTSDAARAAGEVDLTVVAVIGIPVLIEHMLHFVTSTVLCTSEEITASILKLSLS